MCRVLLHHNTAAKGQKQTQCRLEGRRSLQQILQCFPTQRSQGTCFPPGRGAAYSISHTASYSVYLMTGPGAARQGHLIHSDYMLMQPQMS